MKRLLLALGRYIGRRYGYDYYVHGDVARLKSEAEGLLVYTYVSGHLTQAYRAGKTVRVRASNIVRVARRIERQRQLLLHGDN